MNPREVLEERLCDETQKHVTGGELVTPEHPVCPLLAADEVFIDCEHEEHALGFK